MDYLQYINNEAIGLCYQYSFKPYYKWITFNTSITAVFEEMCTLLKF